MNRIILAIIAILILLTTTGVLLQQMVWSRSTDLPIVTVTFLDIGQGDATFFAWSDGTQMLVDCARDNVVLEALGRVMPRYDREIDILVVTHPDLDHYGGCVDLLKRYQVNNVVLNGDTKDDRFWQAFEQVVLDEGGEVMYVSEKDTWSFVSSTIDILYPDHDLQLSSRVPGEDKETSSNDGSIVFTLTVADITLLMMGDAEAALERYLLTQYDDLDIDILKASHHGSGGSSIEPFIDATTPLVTVFSAGIGNPYGHPSERVVRRVERIGSDVYRTDQHGDITVIFGIGGGYTISTRRGNLVQ